MSITANRLSYIFDLSGPSLAIDTVCSSSLVALHEARHALLRGEIDCALVGGVNILAAPFGFISFSQATMLSPTGLCRAFSAEADGYVRAEGGAPIVLAKGVDLIALKIREIAELHEVPIVEDRPLARALYDAVAVDSAIPPEFYRAVAEIVHLIQEKRSSWPIVRNG